MNRLNGLLRGSDSSGLFAKVFGGSLLARAEGPAVNSPAELCDSSQSDLQPQSHGDTGTSPCLRGSVAKSRSGWALLLISLASCGHETRKTEKTATPVRVVAVENFTPRTGERYSASIEPARQVNLAFRVNGFVLYLHQIRA